MFDKMTNKGFKDLGEGLYTHSNFIVDNSFLLNQEHQNLIKKYYYSKISKTPPFPSLQDTPEEFIDNYIVVDNEVNAIANKSKEK